MAFSFGSSSESTLRRREAMVLPQTPKRIPRKREQAQRKKLRPMHRVFPERTAPSQMTASLP